ncbi:MAG: MGMT family protein [Bacillota bacterium]|nr:MGMT family protein [Bacillota bacterium]
MKPKKSWQEKLLDSKDLPKVVILNENAQIHWHGQTMAIPSPMEVNDIMAGVPEGKLITIDIIRRKVAKKHGADIGCPLTTGIFSWIAANAAEEARSEGKKSVTPWWRTLKTGGALNEKYPGGAEHQAGLLESEGHEVIRKGKTYKVAGYEKKLVEI